MSLGFPDKKFKTSSEIRSEIHIYIKKGTSLEKEYTSFLNTTKQTKFCEKKFKLALKWNAYELLFYI